MNKEVNVLVTSINPYLYINPRTKIYYYEDELGNSKYCTAVSDQEAGAKCIMSTTEINFIVAVGSEKCCHEEQFLKPIDLKTTAEFYNTQIDDADSFSQFAYRLAQYVNNIDVDLLKAFEDLSEEEINQYTKDFEDIAKLAFEYHEDKDINKLLHYIRLNESSNHKEIVPLIENITETEIRALLNYAYSKLDSSYKMKSLNCNEDIKMWFAPINKGISDTDSISNILYIFDWILQNKKDVNINIFLDTQGLNQTDGQALFQVVTMLSKQNARFLLKNYIAANTYYDYLIRKIKTSMRSVALTDLSAGINDFINYGKADMLIKYWIDGSVDSSDYIENFVYAMRKIDIGISLCNFAELESGIKEIKRLIHQEYTLSEDDFETGLFSILTRGIIEDYGPLLTGDENKVDTFELIKWACRKKYYQQAITFIESQIPDDIVEKGIWYYAKDEEEKARVLNVFASEYLNTDPKQRYNFNHLNHQIVKFEGRDRLQKNFDISRNENLANYKVSLLEDGEDLPYKAHTVIEDKQLIKDALVVYYDTSDSRNSINHAEREAGQDEASNESNSESYILGKIEGILEKFVTTYQKAVDATLGKSVTYLDITKEEVVAAANTLKKTRRRSRRKPSRYSISCPDEYIAHCENIKDWLLKYPNKHPELMEEDVDFVANELMKTRDEYVKTQKVITYKGYRVLPTEYDKPLVDEENKA